MRAYGTAGNLASMADLFHLHFQWVQAAERSNRARAEAEAALIDGIPVSKDSIEALARLELETEEKLQAYVAAIEQVGSQRTPGWSDPANPPGSLRHP